MAAGFKTATVNASDVPGTLTNYPAYVDLSRLGITTTAEANSVRVYADSGKTTEWAREIVSATEMHVKIPSLTSTTAIYIDWDGSRADYAVTDTYGRNAVWSDYDVVYHMEGNSNDSSGNSRNGTDTSITYNSSYGRLGGQGALFNGTSSKIIIPSYSFTSNGYTLQAWIYRATQGSTMVPFGKDNGTTRVSVIYFASGGTTVEWYPWNTSSSIPGVPSSTISTTTWTKFSWVWNTVDDYIRVLKDSTQDANTSTSTTPLTTTFAHWLGADQFGGGRFWLDGYMDEVRLRKDGITNNWETTEYNNQSDEAGFWGTWSNAGGASVNSNFLSLM